MKNHHQQCLRWDHDNLMEPAIGVLSNPLSGGNKRGLSSIKKILKNRPEVLHREARDPAEIANVLAAFGKAGIKLLVINGGDGTIQAVLTSLFNRKPFDHIPPLAILKAGTTSMTAGDIGLPGRGNQALSRLLFQLQNNRKIRIIQRPVLEVQNGSTASRFGMFFGAAAIPQGIEFFHQRVNRHGLRGELGPGLVMFRFLLAMLGFQRRKILRAVHMTIHLNQQHEATENDYLVVLVSSLERLFFGLHPYWGKEDSPLHFTSVSIKPRYMLRTILQLTRRQRPQHATPEHGYRSHNVDQATIHCTSPYTLDGQIYHPADEKSPITVRQGGTLSFVQLQP
ncbi:MAG: acylglycerol kinase family protein [Pseudomonadota bacterium]|nr:acylglycerol kinase family protein [Pseudomonadota bacterium]